LVADRVELGVQPTLGALDTAGNIPFLSRLAAVRWAFRCVASIMMRSGFGPSLDRAAKIQPIAMMGIAGAQPPSDTGDPRRGVWSLSRASACRPRC